MLQKEYEEDAGIKFGFIEEHTYSNIIVVKDGKEERLGMEASKAIVKSFKNREYISQVGFSTKDIIDKCVIEIGKSLSDTKRKISQYTAEVNIKEEAVIGKETDKHREYNMKDVELKDLPDIVTNLQNETDLTRKTITDILIKSKIDCGMEHFKALGGDVDYLVATDLDDVLNRI